MMYVLRNVDNGKYVAPSGSTNSYTERLQNARVFPTREAAQADACGNDRVVAVRDAFGGRADA